MRQPPRKLVTQGTILLVLAHCFAALVIAASSALIGIGIAGFFGLSFSIGASVGAVIAIIGAIANAWRQSDKE